MLWKTCELNCEKTCELFNFTCFLTCFSHLFHRVWNCWDPVKRAVFTGSEPMQNPVKNPVNFYPVKKPVKDPVKNLLKTCELSHCFSHGRKCQNLWKGHFSQGQNPCKTLWKTLWIFTLLKNLWKTLWKTCELLQCFSPGIKCQNLWTGHFSQGQNLWKTLWNGRSLPGSCMLPEISPPLPKQKINVEVWFLSPSHREPERMHLSCIS